MALHVERHREHLDDPFGNPRRFLLACTPALHQREFVAAQPRNHALLVEGNG